MAVTRAPVERARWIASDPQPEPDLGDRHAGTQVQLRGDPLQLVQLRLLDRLAGGVLEEGA